jgi:ABC-type Mn2+/Zn2+ transport system ATPase subunit
VIKPAFILLDEPFANMDKHSRNHTYDIINQLKADRIGVILTSHDPHSGELAFNRHLHLHQGDMVEKSNTLIIQ